MSKFNRFARDMDKIAREAFEEYQKAAERLKLADEERRQYPQRVGASAEYAAASAKVQAAYLAAVQGQKDVLKKMNDGEYRKRIKELRKELESELFAEFLVKPESVDANTMTLLQSGIMSPEEYAAILNKAADNGNHTMVRLIAKHAEETANAIADRNGINDPAAMALRAVSRQGFSSDGKQWLDCFDFMTSCFDRASRNPGMIKAWDRLTGEAVEKF